MRLYSFTNLYLSSIQNGLQTAHIVSEMAAKYRADQYKGSVQYQQFYEWADSHKTIIILNGGYSSSLHELKRMFDEAGMLNTFPYAHFYEGEDALDGALTAVGIVLPEWYYELASEVRGYRLEPDSEEWRRYVDAEMLPRGMSQFEIDFIPVMNQFSLAH